MRGEPTIPYIIDNNNYAARETSDTPSFNHRGLTFAAYERWFVTTAAEIGNARNQRRLAKERATRIPRRAWHTGRRKKGGAESGGGAGNKVGARWR